MSKSCSAIFVLVIGVFSQLAQAQKCADVPNPVRGVSSFRYVRCYLPKSDPNYKKCVSDARDENRRRRATFEGFLTAVSRQADEFHTHGGEWRRQCVVTAIAKWVDAGALTDARADEETRLRAMVASGVGLSYLKIRQKMPSSVRDWMIRLTNDDYVKLNQMIRVKRQKFNNLQVSSGIYMASVALALIERGRLTNDHRAIADKYWSLSRFIVDRYADMIDNQGFHEIELKREDLAAHYHDFGAKPFSMLIAIGRARGIRGHDPMVEGRRLFGLVGELRISTARMRDKTGFRQSESSLTGSCWRVFIDGIPEHSTLLNRLGFPACRAGEADYEYIRGFGSFRVMSEVFERFAREQGL